jgi:tRNA (guanine-N7-)-methyltransferase
MVPVENADWSPFDGRRTRPDIQHPESTIMMSLRRHALMRKIQPVPPDWRVAFGRNAPIEVDLGCGRGEYAWHRALNFPGIDVVALDTRKKWLDRLRQRCTKEDIPNLRAIRCDVSEDLSILFPASSVSAFTVHHPDPWWKKRHRKRRLIRPEIVEVLADLLTPDGWVYLQTDVPDLANQMKAVFEACARFERLDADRIRREKMPGLASHRETKCQQLGIPFTRLAFGRVENTGER